MMDLYILKGRTPIREYNKDRWTNWYVSHNRSIAKDEIGEVVVSTVFLGIDHGYNGKIQLFETMIFWDGMGGTGGSGARAELVGRAGSWDHAMKIHQRAVNEVLAS